MKNQKARCSLIEVLEGKAMSPVPVAALYPGNGWFPPGSFIRFRFFELLYKHIQESGCSEKEVSFEEILSEVQRQVNVAGDGAPFILSTGSPLTQATTREKLHLFYKSPHLLTKSGDRK